MKDLSIIIVSYNVKDFLLQCLDSVIKSKTDYSFEVIVVDNNSIDDSVQMLYQFKKKYPIEIIESQSNLGFSGANNLGVKKANAQNILLLNPDTVISTNTIQICLDFIYQNDKIGALGVKMIDGNGDFLEESKRGFPSLSASIFKFTGIYKFFKNSSYFNAYYLGHLPEDKANKVEVLCGAFMLMPSKIYGQVGGLDERYFMYGEDIDLSYQITKAGYEIWYLPETSIIHYKGESTKKASLKYYHSFYNAMILFVEKNFELKGNVLKYFFRLLVTGLGFFAFFKSSLKSFLHVLLDVCISFFSLLTVQHVWASFYKKDIHYFDSSRSYLLYGTLALTIALAYFVFGKYDRLSGLRRTILSFFAATVSCLILYALLPDYLRNSRPVLLLSSILIYPLHTLSKALYNYIKFDHFSPTPQSRQGLLIVGKESERHTIDQLIKSNGGAKKVLGLVKVKSEEEKSIEDIISEIRAVKVSEIIFSSNALDFGAIISIISSLGNSYQYKITTQSNEALIGPGTNSTNDLYALDYKLKLSDPMHRRLKLIVNYVLTLVCLPLLIPAVIISNKGISIVKEWILNLFAQRFWVAYDPRISDIIDLPKLLKGTFYVSSTLNKDSIEDNEIRRVNLYYAKDYSVLTDIEIFFKNIFR